MSKQPPIVSQDMGAHAAGLDDDGYRPTGPSIDNRGIHETPNTRPIKGARPDLHDDIDELGFALIWELRKRGYEVHAVEFVVWKTPKCMAVDPIICIAAPKVSA